jgi:hypothetical protein
MELEEEKTKEGKTLEGNIQLLPSQTVNRESIEIEDLNASMSRKRLETLDEPIKETIVNRLIY